MEHKDTKTVRPIVAGLFCAVVSLCLCVLCAPALAQSPDDLFQARCATCHNSGNAVGAPLPETLRQMSWQAILTALETGKMTGIGNTLSPAEREAISKYIGTAASQPALPSSRCSAAPQPGKGGADWNGWADAANTRFQPARAAGLTRQTTPKLKLKWAFGFPGVTTSFGTPTVFDGRVFVGAADGTVYSLDARTGCVYWTYAAVAGVRISPVIGNGSVYFGDLRGNVYALNASTGTLTWRARADEHPLAVITGSPKLDSGRLYVPVSGRDESIAATNPAYECCTFRGSVVALDAATGTRVWRAYTVPDVPKATGQNKVGARTWGPSGVAVWSSPTLDLQAKVIYAGTGVNYSNPPTETSDAIVAFDMDSGRLLWSRQFTTSDSYNFACVGQDKTNCPKDPFIDADLGNSGILRSLGGGKRILIASDKSGMVYGLDPDREGAILWKQKIASGGLNGGFMWGGASDDQGIAYLGISDFTAGKPEVGGGLVALQLATGKKLWMTPAPKPTCLGTPGCSAAQPAPVTVIPGVAFLGSWDGHIRAYETKTGTIIWDFDTAQDFQAVNGVKARGGSINSMAPTVAGGMLYITSGYSGTAMPGNVLLAFSVGGK
ncbi:MAG TPA: PQQ-binding-like beta-propeller repeat protein [Terriglobia bacterium]|nr:PQQ-binding-like beta-propeller repeat protein [Terriglobia bacterium]